MDRGYVDTRAHQAICCWSAPDRASVEALFARAELKPESIREVEEFGAP
jgi:ectoine hydroxylase-related dioxygenase (phytanoyl-CoA dioxygenase family)